ncbi:MAG: RNA polymerase sigma factor [Gammaproteobacteria bacterium]|nr:RNA polymerase sigma factor [Gammaproteobacteria bacterium]
MDSVSMAVTTPCTEDKTRNWISRAQEGDTAAFEQLYHSHVGRVYAVCLRLTGNAATAEECTQDAFLSAWDHLPGFRGESSFATWLTRIAINAALQRMQREHRYLRLIQPGDDQQMAQQAAPDCSPESNLDLERLIAGLPPAARVAFVLHAIEGYSHEEIARLTGTAIGTCKAHVHRARQLLQARLPA